jgi:hypothetical protein
MFPSVAEHGIQLTQLDFHRNPIIAYRTRFVKEKIFFKNIKFSELFSKALRTKHKGRQWIPHQNSLTYWAKEQICDAKDSDSRGSALGSRLSTPPGQVSSFTADPFESPH